MISKLLDELLVLFTSPVALLIFGFACAFVFYEIIDYILHPEKRFDSDSK